MPSKPKRISSKQDIARAIDLTARVCSTYFEGLEQWTRLLRHDPGYAPGRTIVIERGGEMVSSVRVTTRRVRLGVRSALLGGIGDVVTHPGHRSHGYASACLEEALCLMRELGCCVSALGTGRFSFYARLGWEIAIPNYEVRLRAAAPPPAALDGYRRRRFAPDRDLPAVMALYDAYNARRLFSVVRTKGYWRRQLAYSLTAQGGFLAEDPEGFIVITDAKHAIVAYARSRRTRERLEVVEVAARDRRAAVALIGHLAEEFRACREIVVSEPPDGVVAEAARMHWRASCSVAGGDTMVRIVDLRALCGLLAAAFTERLARSEFAQAAGSLTLATEDEAVELAWADGRVRVASGKRGRALRIPRRQMAQLITGYRPTAAVLEELGLREGMTDEQARITDVLFPVGCAHIHALDHF